MKKRIQLKESDIHAIIKETVRNLLKEGYDSLGQNTSFSAVEEGSDLHTALTTAYEAIYPVFENYAQRVEVDDAWENDGRVYQGLKNIVDAIENMMNLRLSDY